MHRIRQAAQAERPQAGPLTPRVALVVRLLILLTGQRQEAAAGPVALSEQAALVEVPFQPGQR
ncbi:MAG TPA: hypothetical protein VLL97_15425 [Acidobacteriota bacterium]|nr:hypothetical protein [Acidobacteriota bacterium]